MILVPLFDLKFLTGFAASGVGTSNRRHSRHLAPGDAAADKAFGDIAARHVEVAEGRAELAGRVKPRDRAAIGAQPALARIVHRSAPSIGADGPDRRGYERRR